MFRFMQLLINKNTKMFYVYIITYTQILPRKASKKLSLVEFIT